MDSSASRAATAAAVGALTDFLAEQDAGTPRELLTRIGLAVATEPDED